ncbi:MAG: GNAT family N-acetyltransferase [Acidimicrobiales bacterium]|nr:GNAT family N-acetyltransferase [Acidimicrobiales bacterium]
MTPPIRPATDADADGLWDLFQLSFGGKDHERSQWMDAAEPDRTLLVEGPRGEVGAAARVLPLEQWFGGRLVPLGGYSPVAVAPEHRGRGWGRAVTVAHLAAMRERGEVIAGLYPAALSLYRAVGFEAAGSYVHRRFPARDLATMAPRHAVEVRRGSPSDLAAVRRCHERSGPGRDGTIRRSGAWWDQRLPPDLAGVALYVIDDPTSPGEVRGYAATRQGPGRRPYDYSVTVVEVLADDPDDVRALWRLVASAYAQAPDLHVIGPAEDDLFLLADHTDPEVVRNEIRWMLRLVDLPGAVAARGWPPGASGTVHLEVADDQAPWNAGRWVLEVDGGLARLSPGGDGSVQASIGGLAAWWSGYAAASRLVRTGHLAGDREAVARLDGLLPAAPPVLLDFY